MRLYMFEHCFLCFRVRMIAALKGIALEETIVLDDDTEIMVSLVGKRQVPILVREGAAPMLESMDIVRLIDAIGTPILTGAERPEIAEWESATAAKAAPLTQPRYPLLGLPELSTPAALANYHARKRQTLGELGELRANTRRLLASLAEKIDELEDLVKSPKAVNGSLSLDDIRVLPLLRSAAVVKDLIFPPKVRGYFDAMMSTIGHHPLPAI